MCFFVWCNIARLEVLPTQWYEPLNGTRDALSLSLVMKRAIDPFLTRNVEDMVAVVCALKKVLTD